MLFEPTYVIPDLRNGLGNGVVDVNNGMTVSWRVNGQPYLASFQITIYQNDAESTQMYTTGQLTDGCPFYATDAEGNPQIFSYTISAAILSSAGIVNGGEYKIVITQWWNANDSISQTSASAFITRDAPTLSISNLVATVTTAEYTFIGAYAQAQNDTLNWVRWQIGQYDAENNLSVVYDSNELYGVSLLQCTYSGFMSGTRYAVMLTVQTENGVEKTTGWKNFSVNYSTQEVVGAFTADPVCGGARLSWQSIAQIPGKGSGSFSISDGILNLTNGASVQWDSVNGGSMEFKPPWTLLYRGQIAANEDMTLLTFLMIGPPNYYLIDIRFQVIRSVSNGSFGYIGLSYYGSSDFFARAETFFPTNSWITVILSPTKMYVRVTDDSTDGLVPSNSLFPGNDIYPADGTGGSVFSWNEAIILQPYTQLDLYIITIFGHSGGVNVDYVEVIRGEPSAEILAQAYESSTYAPTWNINDFMLATFSSSINAGGLDLEGVTGYDIYRSSSASASLQKIYSATMNDGAILYDYGVKNSAGEYTWYLFPTGDTGGVTTIIVNPIETNPLSVCFWDWILLDCSATAGQKNTYTVNAAYRFGKNLESSTIGNNNAPSVRTNLTQYPTVQRSTVNYKSGSLTSFIGSINASGQYSDTIAARDALLALATKANSILFLKNRKGDLWRVAISGAVSFTTLDGTNEQAQSMMIPWVETGSAEGVSIISVSEQL